MAFIYQRPRSPYWWLSWRNPKTGRRHMESTNLRADNPVATREARRLAAEARVRELSEPGLRPSRGSSFAAWVPGFLAQRYSANSKSLSRCRDAWQNLSVWLATHKLSHPRHVTRLHCSAYVEWRLTTKHPALKTVTHNTAVWEIRFFAMILDEAVRRGYLALNHSRKIGVKLLPTRQKPELDERDLADIERTCRRYDRRYREFLQCSYLIARYQGCRLSETNVNPLRDVHLGNRTITFRAKGGKFLTSPLHPKLIPLFRRLQTEQRTLTYDPVPGPSTVWHRVFRKSGVRDRKPGACFHSLRVTAASRLARAGVSLSHAMAILGHASSTIHRSYQRVCVDDLRGALAAL